MTNKITGRLEGWWYDEFNHVIWGHVYEDIRGRFVDGTYIHTSNLLESMPRNPVLMKGMIVHTRNSHYQLGEPLNEH